jgi:preprotein translocase subunit SecE
LNFVQEVRPEAGKVTWPSWKETYLTTMMVFILVTVAMVFFAAVDYTLGLGLNFLLGIR